jgi:myo-inositol 2-dehydrogenase / D-chiro-inositol 1-dehydrogenase
MDRTVNRRDFLGSVAAASAGLVAAAGARGGAQAPARETLGAPRAPEGKPLKAGLIGCGGRGRGAMINFLDSGPGLDITALADLFPDRLDAARAQLKKDKGIDVPQSRCFSGFDGYRKLIDSGVDIVLHCTPPHFRPAHFAAAVDAGKHSFLEKPVAVDPVGARSVVATSEQAASKGLSVMTGTQLRRDQSRIEIRNRVVDGMIGDVLAVRAFREQGALWYRLRQDGWSDMEWMIRDWVNWNWLSGDHIVEQHIHHLDGMIWVLGKAPVKAVGMGARVRRPTGDQYDFFSVDYEFDDGVHLHSTIRQIQGCSNRRDETLVGTKGSASLDKGAIYDGDGKVLYKFAGEGNDSLVQEHADFVTAIRTDTPINTAKDTAISTLVAIMGRESAYTGKAVTMDELMASSLRLGPMEYALGPVNLPATAPLAGTESEPLSE